MIEVKHLTKRYGKLTAIEDISFTVDTGEVLGFLGPNGAGKSTTMNIITGYISSNEGTVTIDGSEILEEPKKTKQKIGYLPENPPLYTDMTVRKYLEFMFDLKRVRLPKLLKPPNVLPRLLPRRKLPVRLPRRQTLMPRLPMPM